MTEFVKFSKAKVRNVLVRGSASICLHPKLPYCVYHNNYYSILDMNESDIDIEKIVYRFVSRISTAMPIFFNRLELNIQINARINNTNTKININNMFKRNLQILNLQDIVTIDFRNAGGIYQLIVDIHNPLDYNKELIIFIMTSILYMVKQALQSGKLYEVTLEEIDKKTGYLLSTYKNRMFEPKEYVTVQEQFGIKQNCHLLFHASVSDNVKEQFTELLTNALGNDRFIYINVNDTQNTIKGLQDDSLPYNTSWYHNYQDKNNLDFYFEFSSNILEDVVNNNTNRDKVFDALKRVHDETLEFYLKIRDKVDIHILCPRYSFGIYNLHKLYEESFC